MSASPTGREGRGDLAQQTYALVLAGGRGTRLHQLTDWRAKPALPFAGDLRIVDFPLSNCVNSSIRRIGVLTQYRAQSLIRHIERSWGFLEASIGEYVEVLPAQQGADDRWYCGTANAVYQNLDLVRESRARYVLVLAGDHVYKMDYRRLLADHVDHGADVTVACTEVPIGEAGAFGIVDVDAQGRVVAFHEKPQRPAHAPGRPDVALASMGIYVFGVDFLCAQLERDAARADSSHDFGRDLLPHAVPRDRVLAHRFADSCVNMVGDRPYWRDVGTVDAYWEANIDLTKVVPELNLYDDEWPLLGLHRQLAPAKFVFDDEGRRGTAIDSLVAGGCIVSGATVRRSVLFTHVRVDDGSLVEDSVVLPGVTIGRDVRLRRAVVDKRCRLPDGFRAGFDPAADARRFHVTERGITLVTPDMLGQSMFSEQRTPCAGT